MVLPIMDKGPVSVSIESWMSILATLSDPAVTLPRSPTCLFTKGYRQEWKKKKKQRNKNGLELKTTKKLVKVKDSSSIHKVYSALKNKHASLHWEQIIT